MDKNELVKDLLFMTPDTIVRDVLKRFNARSLAGIEKYNTTLERNDLTTLEWLTHAQDEVMDFVLYLERLKQEYKVDDRKKHEINKVITFKSE